MGKHKDMKNIITQSGIRIIPTFIVIFVDIQSCRLKQKNFVTNKTAVKYTTKRK